MRRDWKGLLGIVAVTISLCATQAVRAELLLFLEGDKENAPAPSVILDSSGKGNHAVSLGNTGLTPSGNTNGALDIGDANGDILLVNPVGTGAFDSIVDNQSFTIAFWMAGGPSQPKNQSVFWADGDFEGTLARSVNAHIPWSDGNVYFDIAGCCGGTQRVSGPVAEEFWRDDVGEEWTHWAFVLTSPEDFSDAIVYVDGQVALERFGPTDEIPNFLNFSIGGVTNGTNSFGGRLDDFIVADEALAQEQIQQLIDDGPRAVFPGLPDEAPDYNPVAGTGRLINDNGMLTGAAFLEGGELEAWRVERVFRTNVGGTEVIAVADLSEAGLGGTGNIGDANTDVPLGDLSLVSMGADDEVYELRLVMTASDPILGAGADSIFTETFVIPGTGGGGIPPFVSMGDINNDGAINLEDFNILKANFGAMGAVGAAGGQESVPEPSTVLLALLGFGGLAVRMVRRRR